MYYSTVRWRWIMLSRFIKRRSLAKNGCQRRTCSTLAVCLKRIRSGADQMCPTKLWKATTLWHISDPGLWWFTSLILLFLHVPDECRHRLLRCDVFLLRSTCMVVHARYTDYLIKLLTADSRLCQAPANCVWIITVRVITINNGSTTKAAMSLKTAPIETKCSMFLATRKTMAPKYVRGTTTEKTISGGISTISELQLRLVMIFNLGLITRVLFQHIHTYNSCHVFYI